LIGIIQGGPDCDPVFTLREGLCMTHSHSSIGSPDARFNAFNSHQPYHLNVPLLNIHILYDPAVWYWIHNKIYLKADKGVDDKAIDSITEAINGPHKDAEKERRKNFSVVTYPAFK
jgi:hypothetical protein